VQGKGLWVKGSECRVNGLGFRDKGLWILIKRFRDKGLGFRVGV
jgi:hypothetical protein